MTVLLLERGVPVRAFVRTQDHPAQQLRQIGAEVVAEDLGEIAVVDTSAPVAVILGEPGSEGLAAHLEDALARLMSAAIQVELGIVIDSRLWPAGPDIVDRFLRDARTEIVPLDAELTARAMSGWRRYGKGRHPAGLNFGDCFTYALAKRTGDPCCAPATTWPLPI